ncbi:TerD family protein [Streptomyces sp. NPDC048611]|uniref:TerD family protein n=1 Tax=unclassified Streptomyces TaxID=2593676 RepID=UPI0034339A0C
MPDLSKGENAAVAVGCITAELHTVGAPVDLSALLVAVDGKVRSDDDMVFFNQPSAESGAVRHFAADADGPERIEVNPAALPPEVDRVVMVGSCDPEDVTRTFREVDQVTVRVVHAGADPLRFRPPALTDGERAVLLVEMYRRGSAWKLRAIGQGYANGLAGLATDFGVEVEEPEELHAAVGQPEEHSVVPTPAEPAPAPRTSLLKPPLGSISLDKRGHVSVGLDKHDRDLEITASLEWDGGSERRRRLGADLDLYALLVPASKALLGRATPGTLVKSGHTPQGDPLPMQASTGPADAKGTPQATAKRDKSADVVYYKRRGSLKKRPFIRLDGDSRGPGRESVRILRPSEQGYVLLCAYSAVSNGFGSFRSFGAKVVITDGRGSTVTVPLFENTKTRYWVAIALIDFSDPLGATVRHVEAYSARMTERRPVLHPDGTIELNAGPVEFKRR